MTKAPGPSNARRLARAVGDLLASQVVARAAVFLLFIALARVFSKPELGLYALAYSYGYLASVFSELGLRTLTMREATLDSSPGALDALIADVATLRLLAGAATSAAVWGLMLALDYPPATIQATMLGVAMAWIDFFNQNLKTVFRALEKTKRDRQATLLGRFLNVALVGGLAAVGAATPALALLASVAAFLGETLFLARRLREEEGARLRFSFHPGRLADALRATWAFWLTAFAMEICRRLGVVALERFHGDASAAVFGAAHRLFEASAMIPVAVGAAVFPRVARVAAGKGGSGGDRPDLADPAQRQAVGQAYAAILFLLLALLAGPALLATLNAPIATVFLFGAKYADAAPAFAWLGWWLVFVALSNLAGNALIMGGREKALLARAVLAAFCFLCAAWPLIVRRAGALPPGAAAEATAIAMASAEGLFLLLTIASGVRLGLVSKPAAGVAARRDSMIGLAWLAASLAVCGGAGALANLLEPAPSPFPAKALAAWVAAGAAHAGCCLGAFQAARRFARG